MNEDICKREIETHRYGVVIEHYVEIEPCNKPKNPEFLYCDDCMKEIFDESLLKFRERQQSESNGDQKP